MKKVFFTIVSDDYYYGSGTPKFINSFKRFHPDTDLVVFRQDIIDRVFEKEKINFYMAKPTFAKLLTPYYDLVVNIDADTVITARLDEVLKGDYDVGSVWNYNDYENASFENIKAKMYVQAGLVASTNKKFWDIWEKANKDAMRYVRQENDVLNLIWYNDKDVKKMKKVIFDKEKDYMGCKSLGRESEFYVEGNKLMCRKEQVKAYHHAKGKAFPKLNYETMGFTPEVVHFLNAVSQYGKSVRYSSL
jgi:hypothetical protein